MRSRCIQLDEEPLRAQNAETSTPPAPPPPIPAWVAKLPVERMSQKALDSLGEYSCSLPTGTTIGKVWKRNVYAYTNLRHLPPLWVICEYVVHPKPEMRENNVGIESRRPEVIDAKA